MKRVLVISNNEKVYSVLKSNLMGQALEVVQFEKGAVYNFGTFNLIVIVEPYIIKGDYLSIFSIWKRFLSEKAQEVKLFIVGFKNIKHKNYISLLDLTPSFDWEGQALAALSVIEEWQEEDLLRNGEDISSKLSLFFTGHNHESIIDCITHVRATLNNANLYLYGSELLKKEPVPFAQVWKEIILAGRSKLREFNSRWSNYIEYFDIMPFNLQMEQMQARTFVEDLNNFFSGLRRLSEDELKIKEDQFRSLNAFGKIGSLTGVLQSINKQYVNPELIAEVLLIDDDNSFHQMMDRNFAGFHFHHIYTADNARQILEIKDFDFILLDLELDSGEGISLEGVDLIPELKRIKPETPLTIVSTHSKENIISKTLRNGADFYLSKSTLDVEKWTDYFIRLKAKKFYSEEQILALNSIDDQTIKPNILIIEDHNEWVDTLKSLTNDYHFQWVYTPQQALDILKEMPDKFDLLLLDLYFNENGKQINNGITFLKEVKAKYPEIPVIVMTRSVDDKDQIEAFGEGADFYLAKAQFNSNNWLKSIKILVDYKRLKAQQQS